jgi:predicted HNH restriction endonuclease
MEQEILETEKTPFNNIRPDFEYKGKVYTARRKKSLKPYRSKAMEYILEYEKFVREKMDKDLEADYKKFVVENINPNKATEDGKINIKKILQQLLDKGITNLKVVDDYNSTSDSILEMWLTTNDNDKRLCEIYFENADNINLDIEDEDDEEEYFEFIKKVFNSFFLNYKKLAKLLIK